MVIRHHTDKSFLLYAVSNPTTGSVCVTVIRRECQVSLLNMLTPRTQSWVWAEKSWTGVSLSSNQTFWIWFHCLTGDWNNMALPFSFHCSAVVHLNNQWKVSTDPRRLIRHFASAYVWTALHALNLELNYTQQRLSMHKKNTAELQEVTHIKHFQNITWSSYTEPKSHSPFQDSVPLTSAFLKLKHDTGASCLLLYWKVVHNDYLLAFTVSGKAKSPQQSFCLLASGDTVMVWSDCSGKECCKHHDRIHPILVSLQSAYQKQAFFAIIGGFRKGRADQI